MSVLLAERHDGVREALARDLERDGALVDAVADGAAAFDRVISQRFRPDVLISDVRLPHRNGVEVLAGLRSAGLTTPVVLLAGHSEPVDADAVAAFGRARVVAKPVRIDQLRNALRELLSTSFATESSSAEVSR